VQTMDPCTVAHLFEEGVLHVDVVQVNYTANRYSGSLLRWDILARIARIRSA
jgi:hypothetical protein